MRTCRKCNERKPKSEFYEGVRYRGGLNSWCKPCCVAASRGATLKRKYGLTVEQAVELVEAHQGFCAICGAPDANDIDHDHGTGNVRGILCRNCNLGLGHFKDSVERLKEAIIYLQREKP